MKSSYLLLTSYLRDNSYMTDASKEVAMSFPTYLPYVILIGNGLTLFAIFYGLNRALAGASWPRTERLRALTISAVILLGWLAIALGFSGAGFYHVAQSGIPTIQYGLFPPILIGVLLIFPVVGETVTRLRNSLIMNAVLRGSVADANSIPPALLKEMYLVGNRPGTTADS